MMWDVEHECEGNTFVRASLAREEAEARAAELRADDLVVDVRIVPAPLP